MTEFSEELVQHADQVSQRQVAVRDQPFELVELGQVRRVEVFVAEYAVDGEELGRLELLLQQMNTTQWNNDATRKSEHAKTIAGQ